MGAMAFPGKHRAHGALLQGRHVSVRRSKAIGDAARPTASARGELQQPPALTVLAQPDRPVRALFDAPAARAHYEALPLARAVARSEERRVGKGGDGTCRT